MDAGVVIFLSVVIALFFGFLTMSIAEERGRGDSKLGFFLLGFVFPLIGLIVVLVMEKKSNGIDSRNSGVKKALVCEDCGATQSVTNKKCWNCGGKLIIKDTTVKKVQEVGVVSVVSKYCSHCGAKLDGKPNFCPSCGNKVTG